VRLSNASNPAVAEPPVLASCGRPLRSLSVTNGNLGNEEGIASVVRTVWVIEGCPPPIRTRHNRRPLPRPRSLPKPIRAKLATGAAVEGGNHGASHSTHFLYRRQSP
jgi:hypothetical protein